MYGIVEGEIQLRTTDGIIATLGPDEVFGEVAIIDSSPRMATAVATTDTILAVIDRHQFLFLVHETPTLPRRSCRPSRIASGSRTELARGSDERQIDKGERGSRWNFWHPRMVLFETSTQ